MIWFVSCFVAVEGAVEDPRTVFIYKTVFYTELITYIRIYFFLSLSNLNVNSHAFPRITSRRTLFHSKVSPRKQFVFVNYAACHLRRHKGCSQFRKCGHDDVTFAPRLRSLAEKARVHSSYTSWVSYYIAGFSY